MQFRTVILSIAFYLPIFLATTLAVLGTNQYFYILARRRKFATFLDDLFWFTIETSYSIL